MLQIKLLGDCVILQQYQPISGFHTSRSQSLLAYLVLNHHAPQPRQRIAAQLWPDSTDTQARANLRKELSHLRRSLPDSEAVLWIDSKSLQWQVGEHCWVDVVAFETALQAAEHASEPKIVRSLLEEALELYRGNLLPDCMDEWILAERERLQQRYWRALDIFIDQLEQAGEYRSAIAYAQKRLQLDALSETTYCALMRLHAQIGDRANALQIYHRCMTVLREELGIDPSPTTRALYEQLLNNDEVQISESDRPSLSQPLPSPQRETVILSTRSQSYLPLIGRDREWKTVQQWIDTSALEGELLLVTGEPGIGKTRLLQQVMDTLGSEVSVLWGRGFEAEIVRPYGIWIDAMRFVIGGQGRSLSDHPSISVPPDLRFLLPDAGTTSDLPSDRSRLFDAVVQFLLQLCTNTQGVLIILDDVQWMDDASSALLHYASRILSTSPVWVACTARTKELDENDAVLHVFQALRREQRLCTLELLPLDSNYTAELVELVKAQSPRPLSLPSTSNPKSSTDQIFVDSGGNPLFALELARALAYGEPSHTNNLELLIRDRLQRLDESARELVPWAAALGHSFKPTLVAQVADYPLSKLLLAIEHLEKESIIRASTPDRDEISYDFVHDIVRQVAYRQLSDPRRRLVHLQIAQQLHRLIETQPDLAADVAHHAALGGDRTLSATSALAAAERSLKVFAYTEAAELAYRGIEQCQGLDDRTRIRLHLRLLWVIVTAGFQTSQIPQLEEATQRLLDQARSLNLTEDEATGYEVLLILHFDSNDFNKLHHSSQKAVEASRAASPATTAKMLAYGGSCLAEMGREMTRAEALLLEARSLAARVGIEPTDIPCGLGCVYRHNGDYEQARHMLQRAWRMAHGEEDHWREYHSLCYLAMTELEDGHPEVSLRYTREIEAVAAQMKGEGSEGAVAKALSALAHYQIEDSAGVADLATAIATLEKIDTKRMLAYVLLGAAEVDLQHNRPELAYRRAEQALHVAQTVKQPSEVALAQVFLIQSAIALGQGDSPEISAWRTALQNSEIYTLNWRSRIAIRQVIASPSRSSIRRI